MFALGDNEFPVDVTIRPIAPRAGDADIYLQVDPPDAQISRPRSVTITGAALDPQAWTGSGIGSVHVWATRRDVPASAPQFVGTATLGGVRPDVGAAFGPRFETTGFTLTTTLAPGRYDLVVYASSMRTGRFEATRTVQVDVR